MKRKVLSMAFDYSKLRGRIREVFSTQEAFASAMGMSTTSISAKLNNKVEWSQKEISKAAEILNIQAEEIPAYFLTLKV